MTYTTSTIKSSAVLNKYISKMSWLHPTQSMHTIEAIILRTFTNSTIYLYTEHKNATAFVFSLTMIQILFYSTFAT